MRAWVVHGPGPVGSGQPLQVLERPVPEPQAGEILVQVSACAVCRTDLHLTEGDLAPRRPDVVPGHQVVGRVVSSGEGQTRFLAGDRVGVAWLRGTCGTCRFCTRGAENLCPESVFTGWDADGGFADHCVVDADYAYPIPDGFSDEQAAPLLCAGIVGYRALRRTGVKGGRLGIYGFGASAHLAAQVATHEGARVHVVTRSAAAQDLARELGATSAGTGPPPEPLDAALLFAPSGALVPVALEALDRGGRLVVAGIHLTETPPLDYQRHLFYERELVSVTANTRRDGGEFLALAARIGVHVRTVAYPMDRADQALRDLAADRVDGAAVLIAG